MVLDSYAKSLLADILTNETVIAEVTCPGKDHRRIRDYFSNWIAKEFYSQF